MDLICLSALLQELLIKNKRVALPGMGTFVLQDISSIFLLDGKTITPPTKKVYFHTAEIKNDGLLEDAYARKKEISLEESKEAVSLLIKKMRTTLIENMKVDIPGFGDISFGDSYNFYFTVDKSFNVCPDSYPLELISLKPELAHKEHVQVEIADELPANTDDMPEQDVQTFTDTKETVLSTGDIIINDDPVFLQQKEADALISDNIEDEVSFIPNEVAEQEQVTEDSVNEVNQDNRVLIKEDDNSSTCEVVDKAVTKKKIKINKWVLIAVIAVIVLILIIVLVYVFREDFKPMLEKLLYTKEELRILKQAGNI